MKSAVIPGRRAALVSGLLWMIAPFWLAGCVTTTVRPGGGDGRDDSGSGNQPDDDTQAGDDEVAIRFLNLSDAAVDTQFYATNETLENPTTDLIDPQYLVQTDVGAFGSGRLLPGTEDEIFYPCTSTSVLGVGGGEFLDPDLGTTLATGQSRVIQAGFGFDCGNTIIFTFQGTDGDYSTEPPIVDFTD